MIAVIHFGLSAMDDDQQAKLIALTECCAAQGWEVRWEYLDEDSADDNSHRADNGHDGDGLGDPGPGEQAGADIDAAEGGGK